MCTGGACVSFRPGREEVVSTLRQWGDESYVAMVHWLNNAMFCVVRGVVSFPSGHAGSAFLQIAHEEQQCGGFRLAINPATTPNSKHTDFRPQFLRKRVKRGEHDRTRAFPPTACNFSHQTVVWGNFRSAPQLCDEYGRFGA